MPIWIPEYLTKNKTEASNAQTLYIDLPKAEQVSFLQIEVSAQGSATPRTTTTLIDDITKYEVLGEATKVLYSLEPEIAAYIDFVSQGGIYPPMGFNYTSNARETHEFIIPFGRFPFDPEYGLNTADYPSGVQLQIPYDINNARWTSGTFRHSIVMWRPLEKLSFKGFIRSRTVKKETSNAAVETLDHKLPMTYPWRFVGVRVEDLDQNISTDITNVKLNVDEGRLVLYDLLINELRDLDKKRWPRTSSYGIMAAWANATYVKCHTDYPYFTAGESSSIAPLMWKLYAAAGEQAALNIYLHDGSTAGDTYAILMQCGGPNPHKCMTLYDGRQQPFNAPAYTEAKVEYEMAAYTTILHTFVQEVVAGKLA